MVDYYIFSDLACRTPFTYALQIEYTLINKPWQNVNKRGGHDELFKFSHRVRLAGQDIAFDISKIIF